MITVLGLCEQVRATTDGYFDARANGSGDLDPFDDGDGGKDGASGGGGYRAGGPSGGEASPDALVLNFPTRARATRLRNGPPTSPTASVS